MTEMLKTRLHEVLEDMDVEDECMDRFQVLKAQDKTAKENNVEYVEIYILVFIFYLCIYIQFE